MLFQRNKCCHIPVVFGIWEKQGEMGQETNTLSRGGACFTREVTAWLQAASLLPHGLLSFQQLLSLQKQPDRLQRLITQARAGRGREEEGTFTVEVNRLQGAKWGLERPRASSNKPEGLQATEGCVYPLRCFFCPQMESEPTEEDVWEASISFGHALHWTHHTHVCRPLLGHGKVFVLPTSAARRLPAAD